MAESQITLYVVSSIHEKVKRLAAGKIQREAARLLGGVPQQAITDFRRDAPTDFRLTTVVRIVEATAHLPADQRVTWEDFIEHAHELMARGIGTGSRARASPPQEVAEVRGRGKAHEGATTAPVDSTAKRGSKRRSAVLRPVPTQTDAVESQSPTPPDDPPGSQP